MQDGARSLCGNEFVVCVLLLRLMEGDHPNGTAYSFKPVLRRCFSGSNPLFLALSIRLLPLFSTLQGPLLLYLIPILCAIHPAPYLNVCYIVRLSYQPCHLFIGSIPTPGTRLIAHPACLSASVFPTHANRAALLSFYSLGQYPCIHTYTHTQINVCMYVCLYIPYQCIHYLCQY